MKTHTNTANAWRAFQPSPESIKIGIDNGMTGAAFAIHSGGWTWNQFKPRAKVAFNDPFSVVDASSLANWLSTLPLGEIEVLIEAPAMNQGKYSTAIAIASTAASFAVLTNCVLAHNPSALIHVCPAVTWQKFFWSATKKTVAKPSIAMAQTIFNHDFIPAGCRTPKDGITDAAMMAYLLTKPELRLKLIHDLAKSREDKIKRQKKTKAPKTEL